MNPLKPLGHKSYGSIPHLPGSRVGPKDYHISDGQAKIATERARDKYDTIIVQEKLDGSNVGVANINGKIHALTRAGYLASSSQYKQHHLFAYWVKNNEKNFKYLLADGERVCGEWLAQAHGTRYNLWHSPFVAFDIIAGTTRVPYNDFATSVQMAGLEVPYLVGTGPMTVANVIAILDVVNYHGALDPIEGAIWRVERNGKVDFLTKYVRHGKEDGKYLPEKNQTGDPIWNDMKKSYYDIIFPTFLL